MSQAGCVPLVLWLRSHDHSVRASGHAAELTAFIAASVRAFKRSALPFAAQPPGDSNDSVKRTVAWWVVLGEAASARAARLQLQRAHVCNICVPLSADAVAWSCSNDRFEAAMCGTEGLWRSTLGGSTGVADGQSKGDAEKMEAIHGVRRFTRCWLTHAKVTDTFDTVWRALGARADCGIKLGGTEPEAAVPAATDSVARAGTGKVIGRLRLEPMSGSPKVRPTAERLLSRRQRRAAAFGAKDVALTLGTFRLRMHVSHMQQTAVIVSVERFVAGGKVDSELNRGEGGPSAPDCRADAALLLVFGIVEEALRLMQYHRADSSDGRLGLPNVGDLEVTAPPE